MPARPDHASRAAAIQQRYYTETGAAYDAMHAHEADGHHIALRFVSALVEEFRIGSVLDVGCGTGRALRHFQARHPTVQTRGIDPSWALLRQAVEAHGLSAGQVTCGRGEALPYPDESFDAVCELGILHHVPDPNAVVREMLRVARRAVFLSDANRFGQGAWLGRATKLLLWRLKLWRVANHVKTRGRGYVLSAGDGLAYSYSVYDSYDLLAQWASRVILIPTSPPSRRSWAHPLLTAGQVLACALRD